ncbi:U11/U12 small nuclear ribonucleoprotein 65 kDa protein-like isoform X2 [Corylus avellana]|uniref:U11/U12 small nuclear ribonucleoprotein 65 kDa protein-like isoform X2 n=1 Tax=Corylus avellana TaxID=13451 RepID=UPI00286D372E|nr:U11/U12 small nuclear ribonucleoprotein 65 kDa protein-like isoform X2 [Corylus avellana]
MAALLPSSSCTSQLYINPQNQMRQEEEAKAFHGRASEAEEAVITLLIRHLPEAIPLDTLFRLFSHYGASSVRPCFVPKLRNCVFLDFKNEALAYQAHRQLNGYAYPPPDGNILTNIVNALIAVPRFYTQVLHLMNKMNIPAPFRMALPIPPLPPSLPAPPPPPPPVPAKLHLADLSSDESEMESSDEEINGKAYSVGASALKKYGQKRLKQEVIVGPAADKDVVHEAVGVKPATLVPKEIPLIKKKNYVLQIKIAPKVIQNEQKDDSTEKELEDPDKEGSDIKAYATPEELESRKLPPEEILSLPMFKNYAAGCPASVLYVKNLAKDVIADDFYFIFGSVFGSIDAAKSGLRVKLMQEGRMRGQAFVTFPSVELAHRALNLGNGYVFKGKPMIIQFGRNPVAGKAN